MAPHLHEGPAPSPASAHLEARAAPAHSRAQPRQVGGLVRRRARLRPHATTHTCRSHTQQHTSAAAATLKKIFLRFPPGAPTLLLHVPLCLDVSPASLSRLVRLAAAVSRAALSLRAISSADDAALAYTTLGLLRLLKAAPHPPPPSQSTILKPMLTLSCTARPRVHYVSVFRLSHLELAIDYSN